MDNCPICNSGPRPFLVSEEVYEVQCPDCGNFRISGTLAVVGFTKPVFLERLKGYIASENKQGMTPVLNIANWKSRAQSVSTAPPKVGRAGASS